MFHRKNATAPAPSPPPAPGKEPFFMDPMKYTVWIPIGWCVSRSLLYALAVGSIPLMIAWFVSLLPWAIPWKLSLIAAACVFFVAAMGALFIQGAHQRKWVLIAGSGTALLIAYTAVAAMRQWVIFFTAIAFWVTFVYVAIRTYPGDQRRAIGIMEIVTGKDLDGSGAVGDVPRNKESLWVMHSHNNGKEMSGEADPLPHRDLLPILAAGILDERRAFSYRAFADTNISQGKFTDIQREFFAQGLAVYNNGKNDRNGYALNREGVETLETIKAQAEKDKSAPLPYFR